MDKITLLVGMVSSLSQAKFALYTLILAIPSSFAVYRIFFHPLAKYPGPFWAKISILRAVYYTWKGESHLDVWRLHQEYGPIVRYAPNWLVFNSIEGYKDIYGTSQNTNKHSHFKWLNPRAGNIFTLHDKKEHSQRRRHIGVAFSEANVRKFEDRMLARIAKFCNIICPLETNNAGKWSSPLKMSDWLAYLVFDNLTDFLFSMDYNLLGSEKERHIIQHIQDHIIRPAVCGYMPMLAVLKIDKLVFKQATKSTRLFWHWVKKAIAQRSQQVVNRSDVFTQIELSRQSEVSSTVGIQSEVGMFVVGGFDTTTSTLCAALFYLSRNAQAYNNLCLEIRNKFTNESQIRYGPQLKSCSYLHACIEETLRITPPVGTPPWREIGSGGEIIAGHALPQGCAVGTGIYSMHHNDAYFQAPHEFIPERWLSEPGGEQNKLYKAAYMPFSTGPRSCIGRSLAYLELLPTVAILIWRFDFRASTDQDRNIGGGREVEGKQRTGRYNPGEFQLVDWIVGHQQGPVLEFRVRDITRI